MFSQIRDFCFAIFSLLVFTAGGLSQTTIKVEVKNKPTDENWKIFDTRTLGQLQGFEPDFPENKLDQYGGLVGIKYPATGFFYAKKIKGRWWLIDPEGHRFIHMGVCSVSTGSSEMSRQAALKRYKTEAQWARAANKLLDDYGFNGTGAWSDATELSKAEHPPVYTQTWNFMGAFGRAKKLVRQEPGHLGYPNQCIPVFHADFESFCDEYPREISQTKDDPYLLGHFSDIELPLVADLLDRSLKLDESNPDLQPGYEAARRWLEKQKGRPAGLRDITDADRAAFLEYASERYFRITTQAIRKYDSNHLCLGPRLYGASLRRPEVLRAAGKYLDVIAFNYYGAWTPDEKLMTLWARESGRPFVITEWYAKGMDSQLPNNTGAGWTVKTQQDRGYFYHNFTLGLLESKNCVGWHWFKYRDNNPLDLSTDPSNRDSNKGIMNWQFEPYLPLLKAMRQINVNVYRLIEYFDLR